MNDTRLNVHARGDPEISLDTDSGSHAISVGTDNGNTAYGISAETPKPVNVTVDVKDSAILRITANKSVSTENRDYNKLANRPKIEGVMLVGDKSFEELHLNTITNSELENMLI